jgi:hypothetical protein
MLVDLLSDEFDFPPCTEPPMPQGADVEAIVTLFRLLFENIESSKVSSLSGHGFIAQIAGTKPCHIPAEVKVPIIELLLERGAPVEPPDDVYKRPSLFDAELANEKVDNKCQEDRWWRELGGVERLSLHAAVFGGHKIVVQQLLRAGANINRRNHRGETVLHFIDRRTCSVSPQCDKCHIGKHEMLEFLLGEGADVWARDEHGADALSILVRGGSVDLAETLQKRMFMEPPVRFFKDGKIPKST